MTSTEALALLSAYVTDTKIIFWDLVGTAWSLVRYNLKLFFDDAILIKKNNSQLFITFGESEFN